MRLRLWRLRYSWLWPRRPRDTYPRTGRRGWIRWTHSAWSEGGGGTDDRLSSSVAQKGWQGDRRQKAIVCPTVRAPLGWQAEACPTHEAQPSRNGQTPGGATLRLPDGAAGGAGGHGGVRLQRLRNRTLARCRLPRPGAARFHGLAPPRQFRVAHIEADAALRNIDFDAVSF